MSGGFLCFAAFLQQIAAMTEAAQATSIAQDLEHLELEDRLRYLDGICGKKIFTTSLGIEDQVITAAILRASANIEIVTLDTERLFPETRALIDETEARYGLHIQRFRPEPAHIEAYIAQYGRDGFYESVEARHACCDIRKLQPLAAALHGAAIWMTGVRRGQSGARAHMPLAEHDAARNLLKINPLADVTLDEIKDYAARHDVPLNPLHLRGYPSIGCEPCTRAIRPGEPERAGRWWWEQDQKRECGLHVAATPSAIATATFPAHKSEVHPN